MLNQIQPKIKPPLKSSINSISVNKLIGIFAAADSGTVTKRSLGPELVDQFNWFNAAWWNGFDPNWSEGGGWLISNGNNGNLGKWNFWQVGQTYEVRFQITLVSGIFLGPYDGTINGLQTAVGGWFVYEYMPLTAIDMYITSSLFSGTLRALSIKSILPYDVDE